MGIEGADLFAGGSPRNHAIWDWLRVVEPRVSVGMVTALNKKFFVETSMVFVIELGRLKSFPSPIDDDLLFKYCDSIKSWVGVSS